MDVDAVTTSISTMKLIERGEKSFNEKWWHFKLNYNIENVKLLVKTPECKKNRTHYFIEKVQVRVLKQDICILEKNEKEGVLSEYFKTKEFQDLKRSAKYWLQKLLKDLSSLKERLKISE
ncbi:uncharacterized protein LOC131666193 [Phymastichus coffea]|uniref:uncharacterized protein LOC131666193 n=1 Tax=Phymastichus coffea TaxID=108790 RepID=UPI00273BB4CD|nr:uncharacterized protein LOC131666193 [Phymastichus coffea]